MIFMQFSYCLWKNNLSKAIEKLSGNSGAFLGIYHIYVIHFFPYTLPFDFLSHFDDSSNHLRSSSKS